MQVLHTTTDLPQVEGHVQLCDMEVLGHDPAVPSIIIISVMHQQCQYYLSNNSPPDRISVMITISLELSNAA